MSNFNDWIALDFRERDEAVENYKRAQCVRALLWPAVAVLIVVVAYLTVGYV